MIVLDVACKTDRTQARVNTGRPTGDYSRVHMGDLDALEAGGNSMKKRSRFMIC